MLYRRRSLSAQFRRPSCRKRRCCAPVQNMAPSRYPSFTKKCRRHDTLVHLCMICMRRRVTRITGRFGIQLFSYILNINRSPTAGAQRLNTPLDKHWLMDIGYVPITPCSPMISYRIIISNHTYVCI